MYRLSLVLQQNKLVFRGSSKIAISSRRSFTTALNNESFLNGTSSDYVEQQYYAWKKDPSSVHSSWAAFFKNVDVGKPPGTAFVPPPTLFPTTVPVQTPTGQPSVLDNVKVIDLINSYRSLGHKQAKTDPLNRATIPQVPELDYKTYGISDSDLNKEYYFSDTQTFPFNGKPLQEVIKRMKEVYCSTIGVEYMYIENKIEREWIRERVENNIKSNITKEDKINLMDRLIWSDRFERFLMLKFGQDKRFGLDGCEALIPGMKTLIDTAADIGVESVVIGMPHRGRLNVLANVIRKPLEDILKEFAKIPAAELKNDHLHSGDVKYHLGTSYDRTTRNGRSVHLSLMSNPSHLEAVDPLVEGKTRAKQQIINDTERSKVLSLQLHGDAAFAGQGIVYETFQMSELNSFSTGGTIHIVVNNQIGFTTNPTDSRSTPYCTDIAKAFSVPVFHVNGDDPEAVIAVSKLAAEYRQRFHKGCVIDIVSYRRFGHNEMDEPRFTQPIMYSSISKHTSTLELYKKHLTSEGVMKPEEIVAIEDNVGKILQEAFTNAPSFKSKHSNWLESKWKNFKGPEQLARIMDTGVPMETLMKIGNVISQVPEGFSVHQQIAKDLKKRVAMFQSNEPIDWATAEALAFGSLLLEGNHVRLSGQDVERGTFSHRHAVLHDQNTDAKYIPLNNLDKKQSKLDIHNSLLSEYGVLGFELGYSLENPNALIIWEAQFGDFANGAQIIIDQFLSSGEQKWYRQSGLVMLLPHGYDGQGPEHSSCRLERFLQLCDSDPNKIPEMDPAKTKQIQETNMQVVNCTTPANYFHVLRRQIHREFRKPLIVVAPKSLLRHPSAKSALTDFDDVDNARFQRLIPEKNEKILAKNPKSIRKLIFCTGKVYYELVEEREKHKMEDIAIVRVEQICPFPFDLVQNQLKQYPAAKIVWVQEEPMNQGAWTFIQPHLLTTIKSVGSNASVNYVGRPVSASPAAGTGVQHKLELAKFMTEAMS